MAFSHQLVPQRWVLSLLQVPDFKTLCDRVRHVPEGEAEGGQTHFGMELVELTDRPALANDQLRAYDQNITRHTRRMNEGRAEPIVWKYFQYLALLFAEIYLDHYFRDPEALRTALNAELARVNAERARRHTGRGAPAPFPDYTLEDLRTIAFYQATGSGKTLQMHVNIRQFYHYQNRADRTKFTPVHQSILVTPNESLSLQHLGDALASGFEAEILSNASMAAQQRLGETLDIIEVTKLGEKAGEKTIATEAFEGNNLVLVDEAHRGNATEARTWKNRINQLRESGFCFEYSATFAQAVAAANQAVRKEIEATYCKAILFDYSYRYFHGDGFGKDYRIRNLSQSDRNPTLTEEQTRELYLTAAILQFYQQLLIHQEKPADMARFQIKSPLFIWVGSSVMAVSGSGANQTSDVMDAVDFLSRFTNDAPAAVARLTRLLGPTPALLNINGVDFFHRAFDYVKQRGMSPQACYDDIMRRVFNAANPGKIAVHLLKGCDGELSLQVGENPAFGVINVGDAPALHKLLETDPQVDTGERDISTSFFQSINRDDSPMRMLMGSRKFAEGWSSWRVSMMGLLNIGQSEGSMIIQLFGRGVRLQGHEWCLKRSSHCGLPRDQRPDHLPYLENLGVYGIRADFMNRFSQFLQEEGLPADPDSTRVTLPTLENLPKDQKLKKLALPEGMSYRRQGHRPTMRPVPHPYFLRHPVELNWYPVITQIAPRQDQPQAVAQQETPNLKAEQLAFLDHAAIHRELLEYKTLQRWHSLILPPAAVPALLREPDWYKLYIPKAELTPGTLADTARFHEIALSLLKKYLDKLVDVERADWENKRLVATDLTAEDVDRTYTFELDIDQTSGTSNLKSDLEQLAEAIRKNSLAEIDLVRTKISGAEVIAWENLLFVPLLHLKESVLRLSKLALQQSELRFVRDLMAFIQSKPAALDGTQLYLLRNETKSKGIGFFDRGGFYPDFLLWIVRDGKQTVCFIDPHGMRNESPTSPKVQLHTEIKSHQTRIADPNLRLESFIVTETPYLHTHLADAHWTIDDCTKSHVLFMENAGYLKKLFELATI